MFEQSWESETESAIDPRPHFVIVFLKTVGWDGILPFLVALTPFLLSRIFLGANGAELVFVFLVPVLAALVRASIGVFEIAMICEGETPLLRQVAMAAAIIVLFFFESVAGVMAMAKRGPPNAWIVPCALYAVYLVLIWLALRPPAVQKKPDATDLWPSS